MTTIMQLDDNIAKNGGYVIRYVMHDTSIEACFAYTIGLALKHLPDLILLGPYSPPDAAEIVGAIARAFIASPLLARPGDLESVLSHPVRLRAIAPTAAFYAYALEAEKWNRAHNHTPPAPIQVILSDQQGRFPGDSGFNYFCPPIIE